MTNAIPLLEFKLISIQSGRLSPLFDAVLIALKMLAATLFFCPCAMNPLMFQILDYGTCFYNPTGVECKHPELI